MAGTLNESFNSEPFRAASPINFGAAVVLDASTPQQVIAASGASAGLAPVYGIAQASQPTANYNLTVQTGGWAKAVAGASLGIGALVGAGIGTSSLVPVGASGVLASAGPSAGILLPRYAIGRALEAAAAGGIFTVSIKPQEVI